MPPIAPKGAPAPGRHGPTASNEYRGTAQNDNGFLPKTSAEWPPELTSALRHFQRYGLAAKHHAELARQAASRRGDAPACQEWAAIGRMFR